MITAPTLETLAPDLVTNLADSTVRQIVEFDPQIDSSRGAVYDVLSRIHALLTAQTTTLYNEVLANRSLTLIKNDPAAADPDMVTDIVANFGIDRLPAVAAEGEIKIIRDNDTPLVVPVGSIFFSGPLQFTTTTVFSARNDPGDIATPTDRLITKIDNDSYEFTITIVCSQTGSVGMLRAGAIVTPNVVPTGFTSSYAASDFRNGIDSETNEDLIDKLEAGVARPSFASRPAMRALLRGDTTLSDFVCDSIIGAGDAEMRRDRRFLIPVGVGGRVDWYVRTDEVALKTQITKTAVLSEKLTTSDGTPKSVWRILITKDDMPGFYEVASILPVGSTLGGSFAVQSLSRGVNIGVDDPDVSNPVDGRYSRYQTATIDFIDTATDVTALAIGATASYNVVLSAISRIAAIQDGYASNKLVDHPGADCLVRAPFPCWVSVDLSLTRQDTDPLFDNGAIQDAVARVINRTNFIGKLYVSDIINAVYSVIGTNGKVARASARGRLVDNQDNTLLFDSATLIDIPYLPLQGISYRTVQFFSSIDDISITATNSIPVSR